MAIWGSVLKKMDENTMILIFGEFGSSVYIFCDQVLIYEPKKWLKLPIGKKPVHVIVVWTKMYIFANF